MAAPHHDRVTGIITTYDRPTFLADAIESALAQTHGLAELIVVDDCSPSDIAAIVGAFGERVHYLRLARNRGPSAARNAGVAAARGEVVAFLDDDDLWLPEKIERQIEALAAGHEACLCGLRVAQPARSQIVDTDRVTADDLRWGNPFCGTTGLVARRDALLAEPFDETLRWAEDWDVYLRLALRQPLTHVPEALFERRYGEHAGLTRATQYDSLERLLRTADAAKKHRRWLGEWGYRNAVARALLREFSKRPDRHRQLLAALRRAGPAATLATLFLMYRRSTRYQPVD